MNSVLRIALNASPEQGARLQALQSGFAQVCNALAPVVQQTRVWNRVALHHLAYRQLREQFPEMGFADGTAPSIRCRAPKPNGVSAPGQPVQPGAPG